MKVELTKHTVFAYFSGDATALQKQMIEEWLTESENVEKYFDWLEQWERLHPQFHPDINMALEAMSQKLLEKNELVPAKEVRVVRQGFQKKNWIWAAACFVFLSFVGYLAKDLILYKSYQTDYGELNTFLLEDSSVVVLNSNSVLKVPRWTFGESNRHVYLNGEAEFSVKHTRNNQYFQVHNTDKSLITVLGTEFVVYTRSRKTNVVLNKGSVHLSSASGSSTVTMQPGDRATVESNGQIIVEQLTQKEVDERLAWKEHRFVFDDTPLSVVASKINEVFGVEVAINDKSLASRTATGSFPAKNANELLSSMSYMYSFEIAKTSNKIVLIPNP